MKQYKVMRLSAPWTTVILQTLPFVQFQGTLNKRSKITKRGKFVVIWDAWLALTSTQLCLLCCSIMPSWTPFGSAVHTDGKSDLIGQTHYTPEWLWMQHNKIRSYRAWWQFSGFINYIMKNDLWIWVKYNSNLNISMKLSECKLPYFVMDEPGHLSVSLFFQQYKKSEVKRRGMIHWVNLNTLFHFVTK